MKGKVSPSLRLELEEELRKLRHLQRTRMLSLDDGQFVREVVWEMDVRIEDIERQLAREASSSADPTSGLT